MPTFSKEIFSKYLNKKICIYLLLHRLFYPNIKTTAIFQQLFYCLKQDSLKKTTFILLNKFNKFRFVMQARLTFFAVELRHIFFV